MVSSFINALSDLALLKIQERNDDVGFQVVSCDLTNPHVVTFSLLGVLLSEEFQLLWSVRGILHVDLLVVWSTLDMEVVASVEEQTQLVS